MTTVGMGFHDRVCMYAFAIASRKESLFVGVDWHARPRTAATGDRLDADNCRRGGRRRPRLNCLTRPDPQQVRNDSPRPQFYNLTSTDTASDVQRASITWTAFPRIIKITSVGDLQRWQRADASRDVQDEYCEWSVTWEASGKITQVTFTCEGPEYWEILAQTNPDKVVELYHRFISPAVRKEDLFSPSGRYQPGNNSTSHGTCT
ncbi:hypothetical protein [Streptomyces collinus]|uniref:hypothetical protein n=1 Tax=Streptomyces collinus TaxID=42684 RepID=UPI0034087976